MIGLLDRFLIDIGCSACSLRHRKPVSWVRKNASLPCSCGAQIPLGTEYYRGVISGIEQQLHNLDLKASGTRLQ